MAITDKEKNDLHYVCSLIEFIGRKTLQTNRKVVESLGEKELARQLWLADINHCLTFEEVAEELIESYHIPTGDFDRVSMCQYKVPSSIAIGSVYRNLIEDIYTEDSELVDLLYEVFTSFISDKISDFNSSMYYENPSYIKECYLSNEIVM